MNAATGKARVRGFTLIELIIVIAIIALLSAILFPAFASARARARQTACASNLRQIGIALRLYCDDHDGEMPRTAHDHHGSPAVWVLTLAPYITNVYQIRACPEDPRAKEFTEKDLAKPDDPLGKFGTSYLLNEYVAIPQVDPFGQPVADPEVFTSLDGVPRPAETLMAFEASGAIPRDDYWDHAHNRNWFNSANPQTRWHTILDEMEVDRHRSGHVPPVPEVSKAARRTNYDRTVGTTNFLYCDTHVKAVPALRIREWAYQNVNFCKPQR